MKMFDIGQHGLSLRYAYWALVSVVCVNLLWIGSTRISLNWDGLWIQMIEVVYLVIFYFAFGTFTASKRMEYIADQIRILIFGLIFLKLAWINLRILNHLTMTTALPYQDERLARWDSVIGFDWLAYFKFVHEWTVISTVLDASYTSLTPLSAMTLTILILLGLNKRGFFFVELFFFTAILTTLIGLFFPAEAAVIHNNIILKNFPNFSPSTGVYHISSMEELRTAAGEIVIHPSKLPGLVTFPSFHTSAGILMCIAVYRTWLFIPISIYVIIMIASTPVFGGHYAIDLIAGAVLALAVSAILLNTQRYNGVWNSKPTKLRLP